MKLSPTRDRITWTFANDQERRLYLSTRPPFSRKIAEDALSGLIISSAVALAYLSNDLMYHDTPVRTLVLVSLLWTPILLVSVLLEAWKRSRAMQSATVEIRPRRLSLVQTYLVSWMYRKVPVFQVAAWRLRAATWTSDGVVLDTQLLVFHRRYFLSYLFLQTDDVLDIIESWCGRNGVKIDGVRPLPGGYVRPQQEPRGL